MEWKRFYTLLVFALWVVNIALGQQLAVPGSYSTIQSAINAANAGDTVLVADGTYIENIDFKGKAITVASHFVLDGNETHIANTIIDGSQPSDPNKGSTVRMIGCPDTTAVLMGFSITNGSGMIMSTQIGNVFNGGGIYLHNGSGKICNNYVHDNLVRRNDMVVGGGGIAAWPNSPICKIVIRNNKIFDNRCVSNTYCQGGGVVTGCDGGLTIVEGNFIDNNEAKCTGTWKAIGGGLMLGNLQPWNGVLKITRNQISNNKATCIAGQGGGFFLTFPPFNAPFVAGKCGIEISNNLIVGNYSQDRAGALAVWDQNTYNWVTPIPFIVNNTIVDNKTGKGEAVLIWDAKALLMNNIIRNGGNEVGTSSDYNWTNHGSFELFGNNIQNCTPDTTNICETPLFIDNGYGLTDGNKSIGKGVANVTFGNLAFKAPIVDFYGRTRLHYSGDGFVDIGAIESPYKRSDDPTRINVPLEISTIQGGINAANASDTVLVAEGTYFENIDFKGKAITVASKFILNGNESHIANTIIDGSKPLNPDNASVIRMVSQEDTTSILCGFTITKGKGTLLYLDNVYHQVGGGVLMLYSGGKILNNYICNNQLPNPRLYNDTSIAAGCGVYALVASNKIAVIRNNHIYNNTYSSNRGGAGGGLFLCGGKIFVDGNIVHNNLIDAKTTSFGGGMAYHAYNYFGVTHDVAIHNNHFYENQVKSVNNEPAGAGLLIQCRTLPVKAIVYNNIVNQNSSIGTNSSGGGLEVWNGKPVIFNNTIINNRAEIGKQVAFFANSYPRLFNNIIWSDMDDGCSEMHIDDKSVVAATYCNIKNGCVGMGNINANPQFKDEYFNLEDGSPCIGHGTNASIFDAVWYYSPTYDFNGAKRLVISPDPNIDMGAIESPFPTNLKIVNAYRNIVVSPNPMIDFVTVETNNNALIRRIDITDICGKVVLSINNINNNQCRIGRNGLLSGVYLLRVDTGQLQVAKLLVK